jgi:RNA polymerase sigma-70 factor (ECF subfamily)
MSSDGQNPQHDPDGRHRFATTHWSLVLAAGRHASPASREALATLCQTYWYPLYAHVRRRGHRAEEAQDLIQDFFAGLLEKGTLRVADRDRGRFRSFLLAALDHFLANARRRGRARKRGGQRLTLSLDFPVGEGRYAAEPAHDITPDRLYARRWALTVIDQALSRLRDEFARAGKADLLERLTPYLAGNADAEPYRELAARLDTTEGAVKVAVHRLRRRCGELLREEIARTVAGPDEVEEELRDLFDALGNTATGKSL